MAMRQVVITYVTAMPPPPRKIPACHIQDIPLPAYRRLLYMLGLF
jgi:hypothetical protein